MHWSDFTWRTMPFEIRKCQSLGRPKWMNYWQENPIMYNNKRFMKSVLQWRFSCTWLKRFLHQYEHNVRCTWIQPNEWQPDGQMLIGKGQSSDWSVKSIRWHLLNASFSTNYSNILSDNHCRKSGQRQPVSEAYSLKNWLKWRLLQQKRLTGLYTWPPTSVYNFRSLYLMLRLKPPLGISLIRTALWISSRERCIISLWKTRCGSQSNSPSAWSSLKLGLQAIGVQELRKSIGQRVINCGYPKMHLVSLISESIRQMGSLDNFTTDISEQLHIGNVKEAYRSTNTVNYIQQMVKHNDRCTSLDYMKETLSYVALQCWYNIDSAKVFNQLSAADKRQNTHSAHLLRLHHAQKEPFFRPVSQQVHHLSETHVLGVCRSIKLTSLRDASVDFGIPNFGQLFRTQIEDDWGHEVSGLVLRYD